MKFIKMSFEKTKNMHRKPLGLERILTAHRPPEMFDKYHRKLVGGAPYLVCFL